MLQPRELELLLCGNPEYKLDQLKDNARYINYSAKDTVIQWYDT